MSRKPESARRLPDEADTQEMRRSPQEVWADVAESAAFTKIVRRGWGAPRLADATYGKGRTSASFRHLTAAAVRSPSGHRPGSPPSRVSCRGHKEGCLHDQEGVEREGKGGSTEEGEVRYVGGATRDVRA